MIDDGNIRGAVRLVSSDDSLAPHDEETTNFLRQKHPAAPADRGQFSNPAATPQALSFTIDDIKAAIRSFPKGSAGGISGLRPRHLLDSVCSTDGNANVNLLRLLCQFVNRLVSSNHAVPCQVMPILFGANLTALKKKCGGLRPIAVGETLRRLVAKCVSKAVFKKAEALLSPIQLGVGVRGGIEAAVHSACIGLSAASPDTVLAKLDFSNAFNTIRRDSVSCAVAHFLPELAPFLKLCYESESMLTFGESIIYSQEGIQQGDPLGPLFFCLGIHRQLSGLSSKVIVGYLDDVSLLDTIDTIAYDVATFKANCAKIGLLLNAAKCELVTVGGGPPAVHDFVDTTLPGCRLVPMEEAELLGSPIGAVAIQLHLDSLLAKFNLMASRLATLDAHSGFFLLRNCFSMPKFLFTLRTCPTFTNAVQLDAIDQAISNALSLVLNVHLNELKLKQVFLPIAMGGLGIGSTVQLSSSAFLSSLNSCHQLITDIFGLYPPPHPSTEAALAHWRNVSSAVLPSNPTKQRNWSTPVYTRARTELMESSDNIDLARLKGCACPGSGDWLNCLPSSTLGLHLNDEQLRIAVCMRLGCAVSSQHTCVCSAVSDAQGIHALSCHKSRGRHSRHARINDIIARSLTAAGLPCRLEPCGLCRDDGKRPDGITYIPWQRGKCLLWDATVVNRLATSYTTTSSQEGPAVATAAETRKQSKYSSLQRDYHFEAVAFESLGGFGTSTWKFLRRIAKLIGDKTDDVDAWPHLRQRLGIAVQAGNASCIQESFNAF